MKYLADSDFWYGLVVETDAHHKSSKKLLNKIFIEKAGFYCLRLVVYETVTVLSKRVGQKKSLIFLEEFRKLPIKLIDVEIDLEDATWGIFLKQTKKGTSFIDCANLAALEKYKLDGILSFDTFYPPGVRVK